MRRRSARTSHGGRSDGPRLRMAGRWIMRSIVREGHVSSRPRIREAARACLVFLARAGAARVRPELGPTDEEELRPRHEHPPPRSERDLQVRGQQRHHPDLRHRGGRPVQARGLGARPQRAPRRPAPRRSPRDGRLALQGRDDSRSGGFLRSPSRTSAPSCRPPSTRRRWTTPSSRRRSTCATRT